MLNENARFVALVSHVQQFETHRNQFFADIYQFMVVSARIDSRSGDFCDDRQRLLYPLLMRVGLLMPLSNKYIYHAPQSDTCDLTF